MYSIYSLLLQVAFARPNDPNFQDTNVFVRGLPKKWSEVDLYSHLSIFGLIISIKIIVNKYTGLHFYAACQQLLSFLDCLYVWRILFVEQVSRLDELTCCFQAILQP